LYRQGEALIPAFRRTRNPKRGLPSHDGAVGVARSLGVGSGKRESWQIKTWCDWLRLGKRLIPPYEITIIFLNSLSFAEAVNKHSLFGLMERWKNQAGVSEIRDFRMRGSETSHAGKRCGLSWGLEMARKQSEKLFHASGSLFSDYWGFPGAA
jgi:hypothetical protein